MKKMIENKKMRLVLGTYTIYSIMCIFIPKVYAEEDPIRIINNLSDLIFQIITAIGGIVLGLGVFQFGMSWKSHDPSQRTNGLLGILAGIIMVSSKYIMNRITR